MSASREGYSDQRRLDYRRSRSRSLPDLPRHRSKQLSFRGGAGSQGGDHQSSVPGRLLTAGTSGGAAGGARRGLFACERKFSAKSAFWSRVWAATWNATARSFASQGVMRVNAEAIEVRSIFARGSVLDGGINLSGAKLVADFDCTGAEISQHGWGRDLRPGDGKSRRNNTQESAYRRRDEVRCFQDRGRPRLHRCGR